jgi:hypothetical protein
MLVEAGARRRVEPLASKIADAALPEADKLGTRPAVEFARVSIAPNDHRGSQGRMLVIARIGPFGWRATGNHFAA